MATALEWLLSPYHLVWRVKSDQAIEITTTRRLPGQWPWVYDVTPLVYPLKSELQEDKEKNREIFEKAFSDFLKVVGTLTGFAKGDEEIQWLGRGQLLVFGNSGAHAKVSAWLDLVRSGVSDPAKICPDCSEQALKKTA